MRLKLKSDEAHRLARELADETGESMTAAVIAAMRERLERLQRNSCDGYWPSAMIAAHLTEEERRMNADDLLYDENGLPRDC